MAKKDNKNKILSSNNTNKKMEDIKELFEISKTNHNSLQRYLEEVDEKKFIGKWIAVAKRRIFTDKSFKKALQKAQKIEPVKEKILLTKLPIRKIRSFRIKNEEIY